MTDGKYNVFVYGTLMRGQKAHGFLEGAEFIGEYRLDGFAIFDLGRYPGIRERSGYSTCGEVYGVSEDMLREMDIYEDEGTLYHRREVTVCGTGGCLTAFVYVYAHDIPGEPIPGGRWN